MKKVISLFLSLVMLISAVACVDLSSFANEEKIDNRAQWLSALTQTFDMTVEDDNYPDNYFSDLTEDSQYYYDVLLAVEYGIVDIEAGDPVDPEGKVTRDFAAHTLNLCLNFTLEDEENVTYTFTDYEQCENAVDDQIAVNRSWFELVEGEFRPEQTVTYNEFTFMLSDAKTQIESTVVDENYDSSVEVANDVIEIANGTDVSVDENETVTITNCMQTISEGDSFVVYLYDIPKAYVAQSVIVDGDKTVITTKEADTNETFDNIDLQEVSQINDAEFVPAEGLEIVEENVRSYSKAASVFSTKPIDALKNITIAGNMTVDGITMSINAKIKNPELETKINSSQTYLAVNSDIDVSYSVSAKSSKVKSIPLGYWNIFGVGYFKVSLDASLKGGITVTEKVKLTMGSNYTKNDGLRPVMKITHKDFQIAVDATLKVGFKLELGVKIAIVKADIYCFVGFSAKASVVGFPSGTPSSCASLSGYLAVNIGVELTINKFFDSKTYSAEKSFFDDKTSPIKISFHFEDGKKVDKCTRGETPKFLTSESSKNYNSVSSVVVDSNTCGKNVYWTLDSAGTLTISGIGAMRSYISENTPWYSFRLQIKKVVIEQGVTSIGDSAFYDCRSLTNITIPNSVTSIGDDAFCGCSSLTSVTIPNSVTSIGDDAFDYCTSLESITIPNSVTSIGNWAFDDCDSLTCINVDSNNKNYSSQDGVLFNKNKTTLIQYPIGNKRISYTIPDSVARIGSCAFSGCDSLTSVTIGVSVASIGDVAFYNCRSLTSVTIGDSVTSIGVDAFRKCYSLTSVTIGDSVTSIGDGAFRNCYSLTSVTIGDSVTSIGDGAFYCRSLTDIYYNGTQAEWKQVQIGNSNEYLTNANIHFAEHKHIYDDGVITKEVTCTANGVKTYTCTLCKTTKTTAVKALGHKYTTKVVKPTYTSEGYTLHICSRCKKSYKDKKTKKLVLKNTSISKLTAGKKAFTAKWKKQSAATGYQIQYATDSKFTKNKKTVTVSKNKTTSKKISKLKAKKKYYVRIRTYKTVKVNGKNTKVYSSWSKAKTVKTK